MAIEDLYRSAVLDHNREPRNFGALNGATHRSHGINPLCGDEIQVELRLDDGVIQAAGFSGEASAITMASASMMTERIAGLSVDQALRLYDRLRDLVAGSSEPDSVLREELGEMAALEGVRNFPSRAKSATLPWAAMKAAIDGQAVATTE